MPRDRDVPPSSPTPPADPHGPVVDLRRWRERRRTQRNSVPRPPAAAALGRFLRPFPVTLAAWLLLTGHGLWKGLAQPTAWAGFVYLVLALGHIVLHEIGHLMAVNWARYIPHRLLAGPFQLHFERLRPRLGVNPRWRYFLTGHLFFTPVYSTPGKDLAVLSAGPLANLLVLVLQAATTSWPTGDSLRDLSLRANFEIAGLVLLIHLLPLPRTREGAATDGRRLLDLLRGRKIR